VSRIWHPRLVVSGAARATSDAGSARAVPLPGHAQQLRVRTEAGEQLPALMAHREDGDLFLTLLVRGDIGLMPEAGRVLAVEFVTARGLVSLRGVGRRDAGYLRFRPEDDYEVRQRRRWHRVPSVHPAAVLLGADPPGELDTYTIEMGGGGLLLAGPLAARLDDEVAFRLRLPDGERPVTGRGRVVRLDGAGPRAISFEEIGSVDRERIIRYALAASRSVRGDGGPGGRERR
jgi:hypothetical protein